MGILDTALKANGLVTRDFEKIGGPITNAALMGGKDIDPLQSAIDFLRTYATVEWVYSAVYQIQSNLSRLPLRFYTEDKEEKKNYLKDDSRLKVWKRPHPFKSRQMFWMESTGYLELTGELFWYLVRESENQPPVNIIPLRPDRVSIIPHPTEYIQGYVYEINGKKIPFERWEIFYMNYFHPTKDYRGMSPLEAAKNDLILELHSVNWAKDFFKEGMRPSGVYTVPGTLSKDAFDRAQNQINKKYAGKQKSLLLEEGTTYTAISLPPKDVEFIKQRGMTKQGVAAVYGVPPLLMMDLSDSSLLQNTEIQREIFWDETLIPKITAYQEEIETELLPMFGIDGLKCEFDTSNVKALQENQEKKEKRYWEGFTKAAVSPNEIRVDIYGKETMTDPAMDMTYLPANMFPIGSNPAGERSYETRSDEDRRIAIWRTFVARTIPHERRFIDKLKLMFGELKTEVKKNLKKIRSYSVDSKDHRYIITLYIGDEKREAEEVVLFDAEKWTLRFKAGALPIIEATVEGAGSSVLKELASEISFDMYDESVKQFIKARLDSFGTEVIGTTRDEIAKAVTTGMNEGETVEQIGKRLDGMFNITERKRIPTIARTETVSANNFGNMEGMSQSKQVDEHEWLTSRDEKVRESHLYAADGSLMDGKKVKLNEDFPLGSGYGGATKAYPSDYNERCTTIPVRKKRA